MTFKLTIEILNVSEFQFNKDVIVYKNTGKLKEKHLIVDGIGQISESGVTGFQLEKHVIYYSNWQNETWKYSILTRIKEKMPFDQVFTSRLGKKILFNDSKGVFLLNESDGTTKQFDADPFKFLCLLKNNVLFSVDASRTNLLQYYLSEGVECWHLNLSQFGTYKNIDNQDCDYEVQEFIGVLNGLLFIKLNTNELLVLNASTGELNKHVKKINEFAGETSIGWSPNEIPFFRTKYILDEPNNRILALAIDLFYEITVQDQVINTRVFGLKEEYENHGINPQDISQNNIYQDGKLYFMVQEQGRFAILDVASKKIDYVSEPIKIVEKSDRFTKLKEIQVSENKVYVLGNDQVLHIFERE